MQERLTVHLGGFVPVIITSISPGRTQVQPISEEDYQLIVDTYTLIDCVDTGECSLQTFEKIPNAMPAV